MDPSVDGPVGMDPLDMGGDYGGREMDEREMLAAAEGYGDEEYALPSHEPDPGATTTQLAEQYPQIDTPLRVDPPAAMKAPERAESLSRDEHIRASAFSPQAFSARVHTHKILSDPEQLANLEHVTHPQSGTRLTKIESSKKAATSNQASHKTAVSDQNMLAFASQRAGRTEMEGQAYLAMGITLDNMQQFPKAIQSYTKFLGVCKKIGDPVLEGLSYNCIGVDYMMIACPPSEGAEHHEGVRHLSAASTQAIEKAIEYHTKHLEVADDGSRFVASTNLGLCYGLLGQHEAAAAQHQEALRTAINLHSFSGQSIASGNLGLLAMRQNDLDTAKACMEQHLNLVQTLKDSSAEVHAWVQLGHLETKQLNYQAAADAYSHAASIADSQGEIGMVKRINCSIGMANGKKDMDNYMQRLAAFAEVGYEGAPEGPPFALAPQQL